MRFYDADGYTPGLAGQSHRQMSASWPCTHPLGQKQWPELSANGRMKSLASQKPEPKSVDA